MKLRFFTVMARAPDAAEPDRFLANHRVLAVETEFVDDGAQSFWALCVRYVEGGDATDARDARPSRKAAIDYRETLPPDVFAVYARLRTLRNAIAEAENRPANAVFTNAQLAEMAQLGRPSREAIAGIEGVGPARLEAYAERFLEALSGARGVDDAAD